MHSHSDKAAIAGLPLSSGLAFGHFSAFGVGCMLAAEARPLNHSDGTGSVLQGQEGGHPSTDPDLKRSSDSGQRLGCFSSSCSLWQC